MDCDNQLKIDKDPAAGQGSASPVDADADQSKTEYTDLLNLDVDEQKDPVAWKWAIRELVHLRRVENNYLALMDTHAKLDKEYSVYKAKTNFGITYDVFSSIFMAVGPILIGLTPAISDSNPSYLKWTILGLGLLFLVVSVIIKYVSYKK